MTFPGILLKLKQINLRLEYFKVEVLAGNIVLKKILILKLKTLKYFPQFFVLKLFLFVFLMVLFFFYAQSRFFPLLFENILTLTFFCIFFPTGESINQSIF